MEELFLIDINNVSLCDIRKLVNACVIVSELPEPSGRSLFRM